MQYVESSSSVKLDPDNGFGTFSIGAAALPEGEYEAYPVYRTEVSDWQLMPGAAGRTDHVHIVATEEEVAVSEGLTPPAICAMLCAEFPEPILPGASIELPYSICATAAWTGTACLELAPTTGDEEPYYFDYQNFDFTAPTDADATFTLDIPEDMPHGEFLLSLVEKKKNGQVRGVLSQSASITIGEPNGISAIAADADAAYYTLQGLPATSASRGILIKVQGGKATIVKQ